MLKVVEKHFLGLFRKFKSQKTKTKEKIKVQVHVMHCFIYSWLKVKHALTVEKRKD